MNKEDYYKLNQNSQTLIIGHSHAECAYNDTLIDNTVNMAQSGESYFYSYVKLRKILETNENIKRVLVEVTNNNLEKEMDEWTFGKMYVSYRFQKYAHLLSSNEVKLICKKNLFAVASSVPVTIKNYLVYLRTKNMPFYTYADWGGFKKWNISKVDSLLQLINNQENLHSLKTGSPVFKPSSHNLIYLDSIVEFCKKSNKKILFLRAPQHVVYKNVFFDSIYFKTLSQRYSTITLVDFGNMALPDTDFLDFHHLNYKGALKVSKKLDFILKQQYPL